MSALKYGKYNIALPYMIEKMIDIFSCAYNISQTFRGIGSAAERFHGGCCIIPTIYSDRTKPLSMLVSRSADSILEHQNPP